jgi:hypothetical protein
MPAMAAVRYNPLMLTFYNKRLVRSKPKKLALVAMMRKLLVLAFGVLKSESRLMLIINIKRL